MQDQSTIGVNTLIPTSLTNKKENSTGESNNITQFHAKSVFVPGIVAAQAATTPETLALTAGEEKLTYAELERRSSQLAGLLRSLGVGADVLVAVCLERSLSLVIAELAILKAGGAYVPLDPAGPPERLRFMLNDAQTPALITQQRIADRLPDGNWRVVNLDRDDLARDVSSSDLAFPDLEPDQLAYVIYTSGSTGQPKGALVTHANLLNLVLWHQTAFAVNPTDRASQQASPAFDAAVWELWPYLGAGASVHFCDDDLRKNPHALRDWLVAQQITISFVPTGLAEQMMTLDWPRETALRALLTGADTLRHFPPPDLPFALINNYGPTECAVVATSGLVEPSDSAVALPPIGRPIANCEVYILDEHMQSVADDQAGEIYIGGAGVGRGYLNLPALTAERFLPNPFSGKPGDQIYKTGDLGKHLPDGQIAFLGRIDDQIKIRGYRIEPNEIVTELTRHPSVQASAVIAREDASGEKQLVAYVVASPEAEITSESLRDYLYPFLPEYAIPALFVQVECLPLTPNGKLDREALPPPDGANILRDSSVPAAPTELEERVATILGQLLAIPTVGLHDNFFLLGGHSLLGTMVIARVRETFGVDLPLRSIFDAPTAAELAREIDQALRAKVEAMSDEEAQHVLGTLSAPSSLRS